MLNGDQIFLSLFRLIFSGRVDPVVCPKDLLEVGSKMFDKLIECPKFGHVWVSKWIRSNFREYDPDVTSLDPFVDQLFIQVRVQHKARSYLRMKYTFK